MNFDCCKAGILRPVPIRRLAWQRKDLEPASRKKIRQRHFEGQVKYRSSVRTKYPRYKGRATRDRSNIGRNRYEYSRAIRDRSSIASTDANSLCRFVVYPPPSGTRRARDQGGRAKPRLSPLETFRKEKGKNRPNILEKNTQDTTF